MKCPVDGATLVMSERQSIEIDYCPECRGVWLDRGELDKIIDRSLGEPAPPQQAAPQQAAPQPPPQQYQQPQHQSQHQPQYQQTYQQGGYYKKKRKESWLSELFD